MVLSLEHGVWAPNIHFNNPNSDIPALTDGRLRVVTEPVPVRGGIVGINSFGFGGSNVHVILSPHGLKALDQTTPPAIPRLVQASGRTEDAVNTFLNKAQEQRDNPSFLSLLNEVSGVPTAGMPYRGYAVVGAQVDVREVQQTQGTPKPLWYICSGEISFIKDLRGHIEKNQITSVYFHLTCVWNLPVSCQVWVHSGQVWGGV